MKTCYNCFHELPDTARVCPNCGLAADISNEIHYPHALPCGSILAGRYIVGRVLGQGGFGITYLAQEYESKKLVAIKEYYPDAMAIREASSSVVPYNQERAANFEYGKERFIEEAKTLAEFIGNPNIVRVNSYFEENGTACFVMEYVNGISLKKYLKRRGGKLSWEEALWVLAPVMDALSAVHEKGIIHRDVTPDNIVITDGGTMVKGGGTGGVTGGRDTATGTASVKLLDFGAARYSIGERSQSLDIILKQGFAPYEQYIHRSRQGAFTDEYSLAATLYYSITGVIPQEAVERMGEDHLASPRSLGADIPPAAEAALMKALSVRSEDRFRTMGEFKKALLEGSVSSAAAADGKQAAPQVNSAAGSDPAAVRAASGNISSQAQNESDLLDKGAAASSSKNESTADTHQGQPSTLTGSQGKEIIFTKGKDGEGSKSPGDNTGSNDRAPSKSIPKWAVPLIVVLAVSALFFAIKSGGPGSGQNASSGATGSQTAEAVADASEGQLIPDMQELLKKANEGDPDAQYELGKNYFNGTGTEQDYAEALAWYTKAAEQGNADAQFNLGRMYFDGTGTDQDYDKAFKWHRKAAEQGIPEAQYQIGVMYEEGMGTDQSNYDAISWYSKAADQEYAEAQDAVGLIYLNGNGVIQDYEEAMTWFNKAAEQSNADAQFQLGKMYFNGTGVGLDYKKAYEWLSRAADQGLPEAQNMVGDCKKAGLGVDQNFEEAFAWYVKAADQGLPEAQFNLAETYSKGRGVDKDDEKAAGLYKLAAENGYAKAKTNYGCFCLQDVGVEQSSEEAFDWFSQAAEQEDAAGELNLAYMYLTGTGTEQDYEKAMEWFKKAAEGSGTEKDIAISTIADMYAKGIGVEKNEEEAARWLGKDNFALYDRSLLGEYDSTKLSLSKPNIPDDPYFCPHCGAYFMPCSDMVIIEEILPDEEGYYWNCKHCHQIFADIS